MEDIEKKLLAGAAYSLFFEECRTHLAACLEAFQDGSFKDPEVARLLSTRVHTVKGGAGFFKLTEVASVASKLEKLYAEELSDATTNQLPELLDQFKEAVSKLPLPKTQAAQS